MLAQPTFAPSVALGLALPQEGQKVAKLDNRFRVIVDAQIHGVTAPIANYFDWTAQPTSPVFGSAATIQNVTARRYSLWGHF
jgi:hypothetical protein